MPAPIVVTTGGPIQDLPTRKTILQVIQEVCPVIGLAVPQAVFSSTAREHIELQALANEMAARIATDTHDWTRLKTLCTLTGDGTAESFDLPEDYARMLKQAKVWPSTNFFTPLVHYLDTDKWLGDSVLGIQRPVGAWTLIGNQIYIQPALPDATTASFYYISSLYALSKEQEDMSSFTKDDDSFKLDNRVLKLGMIWQWKANKGQPYAEDMQNYEARLSRRISDDGGRKVLRAGRPRLPSDVTIAYPRPVGV